MPIGPGLELDLTGVPWSRRGSYLALSTNTRPRDHPGRDHPVPAGLYVHDVSGYRLWRWNGVFRVIALEEGSPVALEVASATPALLRLRAGAGEVELTWDGEDTVRLRSRGLDVLLEQSAPDRLDAATVLRTGSDEWRLQLGEDAHYAITRLRGSLCRQQDGPGGFRLSPTDGGRAELALAQYRTSYVTPQAWTAFDTCAEDVAADLTRWAGPRADTDDAAALAHYLLWSCTVGPRGLLTSPAVLMSKNWMHAVWSWDHCFTAIGLVGTDPVLAWQQFLLPFEHQEVDGSLPDIVHDSGTARGFVKPPVHGWALRRLQREVALSDTQLRSLYPRLAAWTQWWFTFRDTDADGLPEYFHGCDSGQDNSTAFDAVGYPAAGPDLAAFLVVQLDVLAELARRLDIPDAERWRRHADRLLDLLVSRLWDGTRFRLARGGVRVPEAGSSQLPILPLVLGRRLPTDVMRRLVQELSGRGLLTAHGLASESPQSALYEPDGYWRGPVWAPTTYLVVDGLRACGHPTAARALAEGFVANARRHGFAENWDACTGAALRDRGYTWSAGVYLALERELADPVSWFPGAADGSV